MSAPRVCEGCACTDDNACLDPDTGEPCFWVTDYAGDLCSVCAKLAIAMSPELESARKDRAFLGEMQDALERGYTIDDQDQPRIEIYSPHEAQQYIEETRAARTFGASA